MRQNGRTYHLQDVRTSLRHAQYIEGLNYAEHVRVQEGESELEEVEKEFQAKAKGSGPANGRSANGDGKVNQQRKGESSLRRIAQDVLSPVFVEAFILTFLAEWGDRSQIATIGARIRTTTQSAPLMLVSLRCLSSVAASNDLIQLPGWRAGLAASIDVVGVSLGGILGHAICTGAAVLGGRQMAAHIREKTVAVRKSRPHAGADLCSA